MKINRHVFSNSRLLFRNIPSRISNYLKKDSGGIGLRATALDNLGCTSAANKLRVLPKAKALSCNSIQIIFIHHYFPQGMESLSKLKLFEIQIHKRISNQKSFKMSFNPIFLSHYSFPSPTSDLFVTHGGRAHGPHFGTGYNSLFLSSLV